MPNEAGGRADKLGNRYEGRWLVKQFIRLLKGKLQYVVHEPVTTIPDVADVVIVDNDGVTEFHQCKEYNGSSNDWTLAALRKECILVKARKILEAYPESRYRFISAIPSTNLQALCERAKLNRGTLDEFLLQLSGSHKSSFLQVVEDMEFERQTQADQGGHKEEEARQRQYNQCAFQLLQRMEFIQQHTGEEYRRDLCSELDSLCINSDEAFLLLSSYTTEQNKLGCSITQNEIEIILEKSGFHLKQLQRDHSVPQKISSINQRYTDDFYPINGIDIYREQVDELYCKLMQKRNVIILGRAGAGKSGCIVQLIKKMEENTIPYLVIRLDQSTPEINLGRWGESLGLSASPIHCLHAISPDSQAVIILDQLDAVRWTSQHQTLPLQALKQLISDIKKINIERTNPICVLFACRKFDFDNDRGIAELLRVAEDPFEQVTVSYLDDDSVQRIIGAEYNTYSERLKNILRYPSNLYIWTKIDSKKLTIMTQCGLLEQWWKQIIQKARYYGISERDVQGFIRTLNAYMNQQGKLSIHSSNFSQDNTIADFLRSEGLLSLSNGFFRYVHQSVYDYFISYDMLREVMNGKSIARCLGASTKQTPMVRYQLQLLLEQIAVQDIRQFYTVVKPLISDNTVRYYLRHTVFEVIGQFSVVEEFTAQFVMEYFHDVIWADVLFRTVLIGHVPFVRYLCDMGYIDLMLVDGKQKDQALELLFSINKVKGDLVSDVIGRNLSKSSKMDMSFYKALCWNASDDTDRMFELRMRFLRNSELDVRMSAIVHWLSESHPLRAIRVVELMVDTQRQDGLSLSLSGALLSSLVPAYVNLGVDHFKVAVLLIQNLTSTICDDFTNYQEAKIWMHDEYSSEKNANRAFIEIVTAVACHFAEAKPAFYLQTISSSELSHPSQITLEVILSSMAHLPLKFSDQALEWIMADFENRLFCAFGVSHDKLALAKHCFAVHCKQCSLAVFNKLERRLVGYSDSSIRESLRNKCEALGANKESIRYITSYGQLQVNLLPYMDTLRLCDVTIRFMQAMQRKFKGDNPNFERMHVSMAEWVHSPITSKIEKLRESSLVALINRSKVRSGRKSYFSESTPRMFASDLGKLSQNNPLLVYRALMKAEYPLDIAYVDAMLNCCSIILDGHSITSDQIVDFIVTYKEQCLTNCATAFCRMVRERADDVHTPLILSMVCDIALNHADPQQGVLHMTSYDDPECLTIEALENNALNCARGSAINALAALYSYHEDLYPQLRDVIYKATYDPHPAVRQAILRFIAVIIDCHVDTSFILYKRIGQQDLRGYAGYYTKVFFFKFWGTYSEELQAIGLRLYKGDQKDICEFGAGIIVSGYIYHDTFSDVVQRECLNDPMRAGFIIKTCIGLLDYVSDYHQKIIALLKDYLCNAEGFEQHCDSLFFKERVHPDTDIELVKVIAAKKPSRRLMSNIARYLDEEGVDMEDIADTLRNICKSYLELKRDAPAKEYYMLQEIETHLPILVKRLYDLSEDSPEIREQCLDLWDRMYMDGIDSAWKMMHDISIP